MKPLIIALAIVCLTVTAYAQEPATTASGKNVLLFPDGTWKPAPAGQAGTYTRSAKATTKLVLNKNAFAFFVNSKKWKQEKSDDPETVKFEHKSGDGYGMAITERIAIPIDTLKNIALSNALNAAPDAKITFEEHRVVNGTELLCLHINGTVSGIPFIYFGYYYSGKGGTAQILTYTATNLFDEYQQDFEEFLNGFVVQ